MIDRKVLNLFNDLFVSSVRIDIGEGWCCIRFKNLISTHALPLLLALFNSFVGVSIVLRNWQFFNHHVVSLSSILRYGSITYVNIVANIFFFVRRKKCALLVEKLLRFDHNYGIITNTWKIQTEAKFTRMQIAFAVVGYLTVMLINLAMIVWYEIGPYTKLLFISCIIIGFHFALQQLYAVFFAEHLMIRYRLIRGMLQKDGGQRLLLNVLKLYDQLETMQKLISEAFGLCCVLCSLAVFLNSAIAIYCGIIMSDQGESLVVTLGESGNIVLTLALFYGMIYTFDMLIKEEHEFKNTVKSLQYNLSDKHSDEFLNFLDQINLKLMTESPKITACGLFTLNLQVFNNVVAAIVTYIMILFQFRGFERHPM